MNQTIYGRVRQEHLPKLREFCCENWGSEHPLIHNTRVFDWYYRDENDINIVIAYTEEGDNIDIKGVCGYIPTNKTITPDIFLSYILTKKGVNFGVSLRLIESIKEITKARTINCNNIRRKTGGIYEFLGYTVADMDHYYRLNPDIENYSLCIVNQYKEKEILSKSLKTEEIDDKQKLYDFPFEIYHNLLPYKDKEYITKRYFDYPFHKYTIHRLIDKEKQALLIFRKIIHNSSCMLRVVDYIGDRTLIAHSGHLLDDLITKHGAEYVDWYSYGVKEEDMIYAGFCSTKDDNNMIPFYLSPPMMEDVVITVFISDKDNFMMFRADGDQDRPNLG